MAAANPFGPAPTTTASYDVVFVCNSCLTTQISYAHDAEAFAKLRFRVNSEFFRRRSPALWQSALDRKTPRFELLRTVGDFLRMVIRRCPDLRLWRAYTPPAPLLVHDKT